MNKEELNDYIDTETLADPAADTDGLHCGCRRKPLWRRIIKWILWIVVCLLLLLTLLIGSALLYLTPERLTPLVNEYASEYLDAEVNAHRVELTFWSTFPRFEVSVDTLTIVSHSLDRLPADQRQALTADADSLLSLRRFTGGLNIVKIMTGDVELYDVQLTDPRINLLVANDSINNFDIVPPSEPSAEPSHLPHITIDRFAINGDLRARYRALSDSLDCTLTLTRTALEGVKAPAYTIGMAGDVSAVLPDFSLPTIPFSIDGVIDWDQDHPDALRLSDFKIEAINISASVNADIQLADTLRVNEMTLSVENIDINGLMKLVPEKYLGDLKRLQTDLNVGFDVCLTRAFAPSVDSIPSVIADIRAKASKIRLDQLNIHSLNFLLHADVNGADLNRSIFTLQNFDVVGHAMKFSLKGEVKSPLNNPDVNLDFDGMLTLNRLPAKLLSRLPMTVSGAIRGKTNARFRLNDLSRDRFYRTKIDGELTVVNFSMVMRDGSMDAMLNRGVFRLGSSSRVAVGDRLVDSLLTASVAVDTASVRAPGLQFAGRDLTLGIGMRNISVSSDTSRINPIGGTLHAGRLSLVADSAMTRIGLREATVGGTLRRFEGGDKSPLLDLDVKAERAFYRNADMRTALRNAEASISLHPRVRKPLSARMQARVDSLAAVYPDLSTDSLTRLAFKSMRRRTTVDDGRENIDFGIDNSLSSWMQLWQLNGNVAAKRLSLYTPYYPTRNVVKDVDFEFSTDSVMVHHAYLKSGKSDFTVEGSIKNIRRALRRGSHTPLEIDFRLNSDTIDINDLTATMIRGAAYSGEISDSTLVALEDDDPDVNLSGNESGDVAAVAAVLIPSNIRANLGINARHILYGDLWMSGFTGRASIYDGAMALENMHASTDIGSVDITALYSAPTRHEISFAAGIDIRKLNLEKVLDLMPRLDSIMPMLSEIKGIVDANMTMTTELDSLMNIDFKTLDVALRLKGDSLVLLDSETFRTVAKWMMFKNKKRNMIDHMDVEITVHDGWLDLYPVLFDMDRYHIGVVGNNDMDLNLDYHVAVLKSPIPFKFGINIKGTPDKMKIRLGKAKINEKTVATSRHLTDSLRVNLVNEMNRAFRRGIRRAGMRGLRVQQGEMLKRQTAGTKLNDQSDTLNRSDSLIFIKEGLIEPPEGFVMPGTEEDSKKTEESKRKKK